MNLVFKDPTAGGRTTVRAGEAFTDYQIHGLMGIRLVNASAKDIARATAELGLQPAPFSGEAGLVVRFVESLATSEPLCHLGRDDVGFTRDQFTLLRSRNFARARAQIDFASLGRQMEITCESGLPAIPLFRQLINMVMLARGIVPVHSAAFEFEGRGVLVTGWSHGSKTGTLLAFMAEGASFVGDEWIYLDPEGGRMVGLPDHLEARPWYLDDLPQYRRLAGKGARLRVGLARNLARWIAPLDRSAQMQGSLMAKAIRMAHQGLVGQQSIVLRPQALFGPEACTLQSGLDVVIVAIGRDSPRVDIEATPVEQVARQMAVSFKFEHATLLSCYDKFRFAFPDRRNALLDDLEEIYFGHALQGLSGKPAFTMLHPYPVSIDSLRNAVAPLIKSL